MPIADSDNRSRGAKFRPKPNNRRSGGNTIQSTESEEFTSQLSCRPSVRPEHADRKRRDSAECIKPESPLSTGQREELFGKETRVEGQFVSISSDSESSRTRCNEGTQMAKRTDIEGTAETPGERSTVDRKETRDSSVLFEQTEPIEGPFSGTQPPLKRTKEETTRSGDLFEFDESELLDIARSVSESDGGFLKNAVQINEDRLFDDDYDNGDSALLSTLSYSFNIEAIPKADTNEDSARETMNLVEKLRMQYAIKSGPTSAPTFPNANSSVTADQNPNCPPNEVPSPKSEDCRRNALSLPAVSDKETDSTFAEQALTPSNNSGRSSKWKPLTPAKESVTITTQVEPSVAPEMPSVGPPGFDKETQESAKASPPSGPRGPSPSLYAHNNSSSATQDHTLSPYFFNVPYSTPFHFPPYFSSFFRPEFLPPFLFPSSFSTSSIGDVPVLQRPGVSSQAQPFLCPPHPPLPLSTSGVPTGDSSATAEKPLLDAKQLAPEDSEAQEKSEREQTTLVSTIVAENLQMKKGGSILPAAQMPSDQGSLSSSPAAEGLPLVLPTQEANKSVDVTGPTKEDYSSPPKLPLSPERLTFAELSNDKSPSAIRNISSVRTMNLDTILQGSAPELCDEVPPAVSSSAADSTLLTSEKRQRSTRQAAINATKVTATQLSEMNPPVISAAEPFVTTMEVQTTLQSNLSPTRPRGGARGRGNHRAARGRGGSTSKRGPMGVFEPKLISGLSSQDLAGTVYDFDDFNDGAGDTERGGPLSSKMVRKTEAYCSPLSSKSPKCKTSFPPPQPSGLQRTRKYRETSSESTGFESENEIYRKGICNPSSVDQPEKLSPARKRSIELEVSASSIQVVPPMRLTIPRTNPVSSHIEAHVPSTNNSLTSSRTELIPSSPSSSDLKLDVLRHSDVHSIESLAKQSATDGACLTSSVAPSAIGVGSVVTQPIDQFPRSVSMPGPSVKAMQDLEALDRAIESALAVKPLTSDSVRMEGPSSATVVATSLSVATTTTTMTSMDPSRHALKFKIKGPFLDANYSGNSVGSAINMSSSMNVSNTTSTPTTDSSNLRRMRKKELIRQYVSQDVTPTQPSQLNPFLHFPYSSALAYANEEYLLAGSNDLSEVIGSTNVGTLPTSSNLSQQAASGFAGGKSHISIPKAVASLGSNLGSFGAHDEYITAGPVNDSRDGKRRRKGTALNPPLSRELRNLQMSASIVDPSSHADIIVETQIGRRKERRRGRPPNSKGNTSCLEVALTNDKDNCSSQEFSTQPPPKLKIRFREKLGAGEVVTVCDPAAEVMVDSGSGEIPRTRDEEEAKKIRFRPPKKRLSDSGSDITKMCGGNESQRHENNPPTLEELWRQSMKFREEVMADFSKSERRKGSSSQSVDDSNHASKPDAPPCGLDSKPEFKNKRHKTKTRKDRSKSKDRDGNNRRRPPVATTDLVSIAGGGKDGSEKISVGLGCESGDNSRKRRRSLSRERGSSPLTDGTSARNGVQIIAKDYRENCTAPPKLIIRFGKKPLSGLGSQDSSNDLKLQTTDVEPMESQGSEDVTPPPPLEKPDGDDVPSGVTSVRLMPIKLKLARCSQGSYVTKAKSDSTPPPSPTATPKESCEVR